MDRTGLEPSLRSQSSQDGLAGTSKKCLIGLRALLITLGELGLVEDVRLLSVKDELVLKFDRETSDGEGDRKMGGRVGEKRG